MPIDSTYRLHLQLRGIKPPIWRRVEVPGRITLSQLHGVIQTVMGWFDAHLHEFRIRGVTYGTPDAGFRDETVDERRRRLRDLVRDPGGRFEYVYDFGDDWRVDIRVEAIQAADGAMPRPVLLDGRRSAPPEDVGGVDGYAHFLEAIADPEQEDHEELLEWVGGGFDPEWFDVDGINEALGFETAGRFR